MPAWYGRQTQALARTFAQTCKSLPAVPTAVLLDVRLCRPVSHFTKSGTLTRRAPGWPPARAGDVDNLAKGVLDALVDAGVLPDDSQVVDLHVTKRYAAPDEADGFRLQITGANIDHLKGLPVERAGSGRTGI